MALIVLHLLVEDIGLRNAVPAGRDVVVGLAHILNELANDHRIGALQPGIVEDRLVNEAISTIRLHGETANHAVRPSGRFGEHRNLVLLGFWRVIPVRHRRIKDGCLAQGRTARDRRGQRIEQTSPEPRLHDGKASSLNDHPSTLNFLLFDTAPPPT